MNVPVAESVVNESDKTAKNARSITTDVTPYQDLLNVDLSHRGNYVPKNQQELILLTLVVRSCTVVCNSGISTFNSHRDSGSGD